MELLPCPFCGSRAVKAVWWTSSKNGYAREHNVMCVRCQTVGPTAYTRAEAKRLWNERHDAQKEAEQ